MCRPTCACATWTWRFTTLSDSRGLEVVADVLTLWRGAQLSTDTTMVSPLRQDGTSRPRSANFDGAALEVARRWKEAIYPELSGEGGRARLVVLGESSRPGGTVGPARPGRDSMGETVERDLGVHCCPCLFHVVLGQAPCLWHRRGCPLNQRCHEGVALLVSTM